MRLVGLTGGIACGKSTVARMLRERGIPVVDADVIAREVVEPPSPTLDAIVEAFGPQVLDAGGHLDRKRLGALVFADSEARKRLERITHPAIAAEAARRIRALARAGHPVVVYEVPLLFEVGGRAWVDEVVVVSAPVEVQLARLRARDGLDEAAARARLAAQMPLADKVARANHVLHNDGPLSALAAQVDALVRHWQQASRRS